MAPACPNNQVIVVVASELARPALSRFKSSEAAEAAELQHLQMRSSPPEAPKLARTADKNRPEETTTAYEKSHAPPNPSPERPLTPEAPPKLIRNRSTTPLNR